MTLDQVHSQLAILRDNLDKLSELPQDTYEEFCADFRNLDSALHRLQTSIQALIDIASFATAQKGLGAPKSSLESLQKLESAGHLPVGSTERFAPIIGFRNRVVHLYSSIDPRIVYDILTRERGDLEELGRLLVETVRN